VRTIIEGFGVPGAKNEFTLMRDRAAIIEATAFPAIVADFHRMQRQQFDSGGPRGARWEPLTEQTVRRKAGAGKLMVRSGALRDSLTDENADGAIVRMMPDALELGTSLPYADYHQRGTEHLPARKLVDIGEDEALRWGRILQRALIPTVVITGPLSDEGIVG
jgi:phage gpG-like protein